MQLTIIEKIKKRFPGILYDLFFKKKSTGISIVLHFNQSTTEYFNVAYEVCYGPVLKIIEKEQNIKFVLNFSKHFMLCMERFQKDKNILNTLKEKDNIIFADSMLNQGIMGILDKEVEEMMFPEKKSEYFWIPERCYDENILETIKDHGYRSTFSERECFDDEVVYRYDQLSVYPEHPFSRYVLDSFFMFGKNTFDMKRFLNSGNDFIYAEDAEVLGLWNYERGMDHKCVHKRFKRFLKDIYLNENLISSFPHELNFSEEVQKKHTKPKKNHISSWISESFNGNINQFYEPDFDNFQEFLGSDRILRISRKTTELVKELNKLDLKTEIKKKLFDILYVYLFEFGCPGISSDEGYLWNGIYKLDMFLDLLRLEKNTLVRKRYQEREYFLIRLADIFTIVDDNAQIKSYFDQENDLAIMDELFHELNGKLKYDDNAIALRPHVRKTFDKIDIKTEENKIELLFRKDDVLTISISVDMKGDIKIKKRQEYTVDNPCLLDRLYFDDI